MVDWSSLPIAPSNIQKISDTTATNRELYLAVKFALGQIGWQVVRVYPEGNPELNLLPKPFRQTLERLLLVILLLSLLGLAAMLLLKQWK